MKCDYCMRDVTPDCDWHQGRCPYRQPMISDYDKRFYNLLKAIKNFFTKDDCDCGHKH